MGECNGAFKGGLVDLVLWMTGVAEAITNWGRGVWTAFQCSHVHTLTWNATWNRKKVPNGLTESFDFRFKSRYIYKNITALKNVLAHVARAARFVVIFANKASILPTRLYEHKVPSNYRTTWTYSWIWTSRLEWIPTPHISRWPPTFLTIKTAMEN